MRLQYLLNKNPRVSGPAQFKHVLFKGHLLSLFRSLTGQSRFFSDFLLWF